MSAISSLRFAESTAPGPASQSIDGNKKKTGVDGVDSLGGLTGASALRELFQRQGPSRWAKPMSADDVVSLEKAARALERVMQRLGGGRTEDGVSRLQDVEKQPMETLMLSATLLTVQALGNVAQAKSKALEIMGEAQQRAREKEVQELREQIDKAVEQQHKAKKGGIFGAVCDWIVSAVEVVSGVAKIVGGAMTGNAMMVAGGAMDLLAGTSGLVKAMAETLALIDTAHADKYKSIAATAGKIQLAFEVAGAVVDVTSAARNMVMTKVIPKAAEKVLQEGAEHMIAAAVKEGGKAAIEKAGKALSEQVVKEVSKEVLEVLGQETVEKIIQQAVETVAKRAAKEGTKMATKELTEQIVKEIRRAVIEAVVKAAVHSAVNVTRGVVDASNKIFSGVTEIEKAKLQKQIDLLVVDQQWLQALFGMYEQSKKDTQEKTKSLIEGQASALEGGVTQMKEATTITVRGVASMGHVAVATV
ncbi:MAG TPA: type III secretion system translocon subunit SctE [Trinickia sp.]|uniref:type III secretion system translocon subunit SctE n=1 Tax=Trinickia sp. TaxID=2571163 RepID=UPI002B584F6F|nr:type III secretion system translocon subunit SctE [Trinickia sp.]HTI18331.1 type III secretion system translocon subunit SctE [Trinickia sp.]